MAIPTTWNDKAALRKGWKDAPADDDLADELLEVAKIQVVDFAPTLADPALVPANYRLAQKYQARALWQAMKANVNADVDIVGGEFKVRVYPMDWNIKNMLRPQRGVPSVG